MRSPTIVRGVVLSAALLGAFACTEDDDPPAIPDADGGALDAGVDGSRADGSADASTEDAPTSDAATDAGTPDGTVSDAEVDADAPDASVGKLAIYGVLGSGLPATFVDQDGTGAAAIPAPNGKVTVFGVTPGGRVILHELASVASPIGALVSIRPDGTDRTVLVDAATEADDATIVGFVAIAPDETLYYRVNRTANNDVHLRSVKSDGTGRAASIQLTGGSTGVSNVAFHGVAAGNSPVLDSRYRGRIFTTDSWLAFTEDSLRVRAVSPDLATVSTVLTMTPGLLENVCGITPDGRVIYYRRREIAGSIFDTYSVNLDGSGSSSLTAASPSTYDCQVTIAGHVLVRTLGDGNQIDLNIATSGGLVPLAATSDDEAFVGESSTDRLVYIAMSTDGTSIHAVDATGNNSTTLSPRNDAAGAFGGFIGVTPSGRVLFSRQVTFGGSETLHSVALDGTGRLDHATAGKLVGSDPYGITASSRFIYRHFESTSSTTRLVSMRTDAVVSAGTPDQFPVTTEPMQLSLVLD